jgi:hypothetical protein
MPMWDDEPEKGPGTCVRCYRYVKNGRVHSIARISGPDVRIVLHANPDDCEPVTPSTTRRTTP